MIWVACRVCGHVTTNTKFMGHVCNGKSASGTYAPLASDMRDATPNEARYAEIAMEARWYGWRRT